MPLKLSLPSESTNSPLTNCGVNTENILFICSGAFVDLKETSTEGLIDFGMIPEFIGRFSLIAEIDQLNFEDYKKILIDSKGSVLNSYRQWFASEGVGIVVKNSALNFIAQKAVDKKLGARGLQSILDDIFLEAQFELPSMDVKPKCLVLDDETVKENKTKWIV